MTEKMLGLSPCGIFGYSHMLGGLAGDQAEYARVPFADVGTLKVPDNLPNDLIRYGGLTILTDPTFIHMHEQVPLGCRLHATRLTNPAIEMRNLPPLDLIVLSHFHGDHFDQVA
jgi:hypothetical protein